MHRLAEALELAEEPVMGRLGVFGLSRRSDLCRDGVWDLTEDDVLRGGVHGQR
jgi:hypothetical protein